MFERSKASLAQLEESLERAVARARAQVGATRSEVEALDASVLRALDGVAGHTAAARSRAAGDAAAVRARLAALRSEAG